MEEIDSLMQEAIDDGVFPGGVLLVSRESAILFFNAYGYANIFSRTLMKQDTLFDLASLTKPLATSVALMRLIQSNTLDLSHSLESILPRFKGTDKASITLKQLLCHSSGLPDYRSYYSILMELPPRDRKKSLRELLIKEPLINPIGKKEVYSDIGFMILEWVIEEATGIRLDHFVAKDVYMPLGLRNLLFVDLNSPNLASKAHKDKFAATEFCPWRKTLLNGAVHDDNAYAVGGIGGHAGLFGDAIEVNALLSELLFAYHGGSQKNIFQQKVVQTFFSQQENTGRALGFDMPSEKESSCGKYFSKKTIGHLGFTGVSFWVDLKRMIIVILLTNRVHPSRDNLKIKAFRPKLHDAVMKWVINTGAIFRV